MGIILIVSACIVLGICLFLLLKWVFTKKIRSVFMFLFLVAFVLGLTVNSMFFMKMKVIQSKVYPHLFLIKNPVEDRSRVYQEVQEIVLQKEDNQGKFNNASSDDELTSKLLFYEYNSGDWGESGTAYFIEHKERRDGMTAEILGYYPEYLIAEYTQKLCKEGPGHFGKIDYYNNRKRVKIDTLLNSCNQ